MMQEPQTSFPAARQEPDIEPCAECGVDVVADPMDGGLNCARCGQWEVLCAGCMPKNVTEYARDAIWCCAECREEPLDS
jgi:hypothetical protein